MVQIRREGFAVFVDGICVNVFEHRWVLVCLVPVVL